MVTYINYLIIMKKLISISVLFIFAFNLFGQNIIDRHFEYLVDSDESTVIHVAGLTFQLASNFVPEEDDTGEFLQSIESFDLVAMDDQANPRGLYNTALGHIGDDYEELMNIKDKEGNFSLFIDEEEGIVYEIVGTGASDDDFVIFSLLGKMRLDQVGELINKIDDQGIKVLKDLDIKSIEDVKVYPNPVTASGDLSIEVPSDMIGANATIYDASGATVRTFVINQGTQKIKMDIDPGYHVISLDKDGTTIKKKVLVVR